jgi:class 3 adenylate cyclase
MVRTFAFIDLCGFTGYTEDRGLGAAVEVLNHLRATVRPLAELHLVRIAKWIGDGALLCGLDPEQVSRCVIEARDTVAETGPLPLRGGIAQGRAVLFEGDDYVGAAVNTAARLVQRARRNQVLATADVAAHLEGLVTLRPCPALRPGAHRAQVEVRELLASPRLRPTAFADATRIDRCLPS